MYIFYCIILNLHCNFHEFLLIGLDYLNFYLPKMRFEQ